MSDQSASSATADTPPRDRFRTVLLTLLAILTAVMLLAVLRLAASIAVPVVFSIFLALLVFPVDHAIARRMPRRLSWLGHAAAMALILVLLGALTLALWFTARQVAGEMPSEAGGVGALLDQAVTAIAGDDAASPSSAPREAPLADLTSGDGPLSGLSGMLGGLGNEVVQMGMDWATGLARGMLGAAGGLAGGLVLVFFLTLLMLLEAAQWRDKSSSALPREADRRALSSVSAIAARLRRYMIARTVLGVLTAAAYTLWLWFSGVDLLIVWAVLAFALNYIPTLGSIISGVVPVAYAFLTRDFGTAILAGAGILVIEQVIGNFIDPRVQGRTVSLSPLVVLVALLVWTWMWGIAGMLLAVPMTIAALVIFAHVPALRPLALFLSNETDFSGLDRVVGH